MIYSIGKNYSIRPFRNNDSTKLSRAEGSSMIGICSFGGGNGTIAESTCNK